MASDAADISVIIPARNAASAIGRTLASLAPERALIGEVLLIDDGSDDDTAAVAREAADGLGLPLQTIGSSARSPGGARNHGLRLSTGAFVYLLDADDEALRGGLARLRGELLAHDRASLALGAAIRRTEGRPDKLKTPFGYTGDRAGNVCNYLRNALWPIAVGSALIRGPAARAERFPEGFALDEDTCYFAALLARCEVRAIPDRVLLYHLDEPRMARRYLASPAATHAAIAAGLDGLTDADRASIAWRKAWIALRMGRELLRHGRFADARRMLELAEREPDIRRGWKIRQYRLRATTGALLRQRVRRPVPEPNRVKRSGGMRTLIVTADPAWPPISGADLRNWQNAAAASRLGETVLASVRPALDGRDGGIRTVGLMRDGDPRGRAIARRRTGIDTRITRKALERLRTLANEFRPDAIIVEGIHLHPLIRPLRPLASRLILDMHNVESVLREGELPRAPSPRWGRGDARLIRDQERAALAIVDEVWLCSAPDLARLQRLHRPSVRLAIVPNGIPRPERSPDPLPALSVQSRGAPLILFVGHLGYEPNLHAALRLVERILPLIRAERPEARLVIAGRHPPSMLRAACADSRVELIDSPPDLDELLARADLSIVPLASGGGTRLKILEAMAWGVPVVATAVAAEGLGLAPDYHIAIADTDVGLAEAALALLADPARRERQRQRAAAVARRRFGPDAIAHAVRASLDDEAFADVETG